MYASSVCDAQLCCSCSTQLVALYNVLCLCLKRWSAALVRKFSAWTERLYSWGWGEVFFCCNSRSNNSMLKRLFCTSFQSPRKLPAWARIVKKRIPNAYDKSQLSLQVVACQVTLVCLSESGQNNDWVWKICVRRTNNTLLICAGFLKQTWLVYWLPACLGRLRWDCQCCGREVQCCK